VPGVLAGADVLVLPRSLGEFSQAGFPNKLGEYLASGRPVVVTKVGDIPNYLVDGQSAFLVDPDDCDAFARALVSALTDPAQAEVIGARGQAVARQLLASPMVARRIADFIAQLPPRHGAEQQRTRGLRRARVVVRRFVTIGAHGVRRGLASARHRLGRLWRKLYYAPEGYTRVTALKIAIVRLLRYLRLKPPAPGE